MSRGLQNKIIILLLYFVLPSIRRERIIFG